MTALKALGWAAAIIIFCAGVQLMTRFDGWMRGLGLSFPIVGNRAYAVWSGRFVQVLALGIGIYGLVQIPSD